jgi:adenine/guanine phosphoribosyltransferase-like PRPP-binding protein
MIISLLAIDLNKEIFFDSILREIHLSKDDTITLDISNAFGINDFQLTTLPFVISFIKNKLKKRVIIRYYIETLFEDDPFFDYLSSSGFFDLVDKDCTLQLSRPRIVKTNAEDPLIQYQAFKNIISSDESNNVSQILLYELSSNMDVIKDILKEEVFGKTDVAIKMARTFTKELIENINQHSNASTGVVRLRYERIPQLIGTQFHNVTNINEYFLNQKGFGFFILTVSDDGEGLVSNLKRKYRSEEFIPNENESLDDMMSRTSEWWIRRAFAMHRVRESNKRTRLGLRVILDTLSDYEGMMYVRAEDASLCLWKSAGTDMFSGSYLEPFISGTHYTLYLPAKEKRRTELPTIRIYTDSSTILLKDLNNIDLSSFDIGEHYKLFPLITDIETNQKYVDKTIERLDSFISTESSVGKLIQIDFSNAINTRAQDYVHIVYRLYKINGKLLTSNCILRNVSDHVIAALGESQLANELWESRAILFAFDGRDSIFPIGCKSKNCAADIRRLLSGDLINMSDLSRETREVISASSLILGHGTIEGDDIAYIAPFRTIFLRHNHLVVMNELEKSRALLSGGFRIDEKYSVNGYLVSYLMYQNPTICRMFAKEIAKKLGDKVPNRIVTYSTTGMIIYFYLKEYYYRYLKLSLFQGPENVTFIYGSQINGDDKVVVLTDVSATGAFISKLRNVVLDSISDESHILLVLSIFNIESVGVTKEVAYDYLFSVPNLAISLDPENSNSASTLMSARPPSHGSYSQMPNVYQRHQVTIEKLNMKRELASKYITETPEGFTQYVSKIDDENLTEFELYVHWRHIGNIFQRGHIEREHIHFDVYDIPERLLFDIISVVSLEGYIKRYVWSFKEYVDYIVYPRHNTAAYLAHMVANKFVRKPIVAAARTFSGGYLALPDSATARMDGKNVLLIDDACNTGMTLKEIIGLVSLYGGNVTGVFTISNRNTPENEVLLRKLVPKVATAYRLNLKVYSKGKCYLCDKHDKIDALLKKVASKRMVAYFERRLSKYAIEKYESQ